MQPKETFTAKEIEQDIATGMKHPAEMPEGSYSKISIVAFFAALLLLVLTFVLPKFVLLFFLIIFLAIPLYALARFLWIKHKIKNINLDDYERSTAIISHVYEEDYVVQEHNHHRRTVHNYSITFENGQTFRLPKINYQWSRERSMSDFALYQATHRGDEFIVVTHRQTGEIAAVYPTAVFTYKA